MCLTNNVNTCPKSKERTQARTWLPHPFAGGRQHCVLTAVLGPVKPLLRGFSRCCRLCLSLCQPMVCFSGDQGRHLCKRSKSPNSVPKAWAQTGLWCQVTSWNITPTSHGLEGKLLCVEFGILGTRVQGKVPTEVPARDATVSFNSHNNKHVYL